LATQANPIGETSHTRYGYIQKGTETCSLSTINIPLFGTENSRVYLLISKWQRMTFIRQWCFI